MFKWILLNLLSITLVASQSWKEAVPSADKFDWVQTTSGEWLKGEIKGMYERELEFDSDEFGIQFIDWDDVKQLMSHSITSLNIENVGTLSGRLHIHDDIIVLTTPTKTHEIQRNQIISLTNGGDTESSYWSGKLSFGLTLDSGNTDRTEYTTKFNTKRQTSSTRFQANYIGNYTKTNDVETENNHRVNASIDIFQTRRFFWRPAFVEFFKDVFQNIASKYSYGAGAGYDIYASPRTNWTVFAGPAYQKTNFETVPDGDDDSETTPAFLITSDYDIELTKSIDLIIKYQAYLVNKRSGTYVQHALTSLETELIKDFDLDVTWIWDRIQDPTQNADGSLPDRDDFKTIISIAYSF